MKYYDVHTDSFITDRAKIIDKLTEHAARMLTWSESRQYEGQRRAPAQMALLQEAANDGPPMALGGPRMALTVVTQALWKAWVQPA